MSPERSKKMMREESPEEKMSERLMRTMENAKETVEMMRERAMKKAADIMSRRKMLDMKMMKNMMNNMMNMIVIFNILMTNIMKMMNTILILKMNKIKKPSIIDSIKIGFSNLLNSNQDDNKTTR